MGLRSCDSCFFLSPTPASPCLFVRAVLSIADGHSRLQVCIALLFWNTGVELSKGLGVLTCGAAFEGSTGVHRAAEAMEVSTSGFSLSDPPPRGTAVRGFAPSEGIPSDGSCFSLTAEAAAPAKEQTVMPPEKRLRRGPVLTQANRTEAIFPSEPITGGGTAVPATLSDAYVNGTGYWDQGQQNQQQEPVPLGGNTPSVPKETEEDVSVALAESPGGASSGIATAGEKASTQSEGCAGGFSLGVFFGTGGGEDLDLESAVMNRQLGTHSGDPPPPPSQTAGDLGDPHEGAFTFAALGDPHEGAFTFAALPGTREQDAFPGYTATAEPAESSTPAQAQGTTSSSVEADDAGVVAGSPDGSQAMPQKTAESTEGVSGGDRDAGIAGSAAAAATNHSGERGHSSDSSSSALVASPSPAAARDDVNSSTINTSVHSNSSSTAADAASSKSSSAANAAAADSPATEPVSSSRNRASATGEVEVSAGDANEVIDLSNIEVVDSDDGSDVPVVDVETEAVCVGSVPCNSESSSGGSRGEASQRPPPGSPAAVVLDSDDDDVVELRYRQAVPFTVHEYSTYMMRHPMVYAQSAAAGFTGMPMIAHLRHRLLQQEMLQRREEEEASSNPALPRCPICLKRYRQQKQEEEAARPEQTSDATGETQSGAAGDPGGPSSESHSNSAPDRSTEQRNWKPPPPRPLDSAESDRDHVVALKCGHVFCKGCIQVALRNRRQCPVCRVVLRGSRPYQRIFL